MPDTLPLHAWYSLTDAVAAFAGAESPEEFCEGQFLVLPSAILCFITTGPSIDEPHVPSPSHVVWRPHPDTKVPEKLPGKAMRVWDESANPRRRIRDHHVFLRPEKAADYFYCGEAHLSSHGSMRTSSGGFEFGAAFSLKSKMPRDVWIKLGGYPGWLVEVNHKSHRVAADDLPAFEQLLRELTSSDFSHLNMTRYEEDALILFTNPSRGWLTYETEAGDGGIYTRDPQYTGPADKKESFYCTCGIDLEFDAVQTLPRELAAQAALEFFRTGRLPACVHWD